jgi:hypothetical protein
VKNACNNSVGNEKEGGSSGKRSDSEHRGPDINMDLNEIRCEDVQPIHLPEDAMHWREHSGVSSGSIKLSFLNFS